MERRRACYIGGTEFDEDVLHAHVSGLRRKTLVVTGNGRGAETWVRDVAPTFGLEVYVPEFVDVRRQITDIYIQAMYGGLLVLVGEGFRVQRARQMLARSNGWPQEVEQI